MYPDDISVSGLSSSNYEIALVNGTLTITQSETTTTLNSNPITVEYGAPVTLTATVTAGATGTVLFQEGADVLGSAVLNGNTATLTNSTLNAGKHTITATYMGDQNYGSSTSSPVTITVKQKTGTGPGNAALIITVNNATRPYGQANPAFNYTPSGTLVGTDTYASAIQGIALYSTSAKINSPAGTYPVFASGLFSPNYVLAFVPGNLVVNPPPDFAIANLTSPQLIPPGASASYTIQLTSVNGIFNNLVTLTATNLPPGATYTYTPPAVTPGAAGATSIFTVTVPKQTAESNRRGSESSLALAVLLLPLTLIRRVRKSPQRLLVWIILSFGFLGAITGCGVGGYFSQPQQTYVITVTGTSGNLVHGTTATLTVQ